jgi:hypothetical protein
VGVEGGYMERCVAVVLIATAAKASRRLWSVSREVREVVGVAQPELFRCLSKLDSRFVSRLRV